VKRFGVLVLALLVVGCVTDTNGKSVSIFNEECSEEHDKFYTSFSCEIIENYEDLTLPFQAEAMSLNSGKKVHHAVAQNLSGKMNYKRRVLEVCEDLYSNCIISKDVIASTPDYKDLADYKRKQALNRRQLVEVQARNKALIEERLGERASNKEIEEARARQIKEREDARVASNLDNYKKACKDYGFTSKRDIATCVQQEIRFDKQEAILTAQNQQLMAQNKEIEELRAAIMKVPEKSKKNTLLELLEPYVEMEEIKNQRQRDADIQAIKRALYR
jgi:hypothetical protein